MRIFFVMQIPIIDAINNSTGARIGNNVTISSTALYLLHLPNDILSTIPTFVKNAGMGEGPNYLNPLGIISNIAGMAFDFLVWVASGGVLLLLAHLVQMGMGAIGNMLAAAAAAVQDVVDAIVDAFCAFMDWVIEFIQYILESTVGTALGSIGIGTSAICGNTPMLMVEAKDLIESEQQSETGAAIIVGASILDEINALLIITTAVVAVMLVLSIVLAPYSFLISEVVIPLVLTMMVTTLLQTVLNFDPFDLIGGGSPLENQMGEILGSELAAQMETAIGLSIAIFNFLSDKVLMFLEFNALGVISFVFSVIGFSLALWSLAINDPVEALFAGIGGFICSIAGLGLYLAQPIKVPSIGKFLLGFSIFDIGVSTFSLFTTALRANDA